MKIWQKTIAVISTFALLFNSIAAPLSVLAQTATPIASPEPTAEAAEVITDNTTTSEPTEESVDTSTGNITETQANDDEVLSTKEGSTSGTLEDLSEKISVETLSVSVSETSAEITTETHESTSKSSDWTFENVELNKEYQNGGVTLTFTKLPSPTGNIKIEEITLTQEQIQQTGSLSDKAYDITSDMKDGDFSYNLSLPIPEASKGKTVEVKFAEELSNIGSAETVENDLTKTDTSVSVASLDHFTIFVVTSLNTQDGCNAVLSGTTLGTTCFSTIQAAIEAANLDNSGGTHTINVAPGIYTERIWITKAVNLLGADKATTTIRGITAKDSIIGVNNVTGPMTISGFTIDANNYPSYADGEWQNGIYIYNSSQVTIEQNNIINFKADGVSLGAGSHNNVVKKNVITGSTDGSSSGINISDNSGGSTIGGAAPSDGNTISLATSGIGNLYGVYLSGTNSGNNTIENNTFDGGTRFVQQDGGVSGTTTISGNIVGNTTGPTFAGVSLNGGSAIISGNTLKNAVRPIDFWGVTNVTISGNTISGSVYDGINAGSATGTVKINGNNKIYSIANGGYEIHVQSGVDGIEIDGNEIYSSEKGIGIESGATGAKITNNNIHNNTYNAMFLNEVVTSLTGNILNANARGIETQKSLTASSNKFTNTTYCSVCLYAGGMTYNVSQNWWGTAVSATVASRIADNGHAVTFAPYYVDSGLLKLSDVAVNTVYVNGTYTDGSADSHIFGYDAFTTIQEGISAVDAGGTVNVAAGTYAGNINVTKSVTILGDPGDASAGPGSNAPVIDGGSTFGSAFFIANGVSNVTIKGFEMRNFTSNGNGIGNGISAWVGSTANITIQDNYFHNLGYNGVLVGNDKSATPSEWGDHTNWTIKGNILETFEAYGFELTNTSNSSIENNIIHSNATWNLAATAIMVDARRNASGIVIKGNQIDGEMWPGYPAVYVFANSFELANVNLNDVLIEDNTISTTGTQSQVYVYNYDGTGTVTDVRVHGNSLSTFKNGTPATIDAINNWWGVASPSFGTIISGDVDHDPWYTNAAKTTLSDNTYTDAVVSSSQDGQADLPAGVTDIVLTNGTVLDLSAGLVGNTVTLQSGVNGEDVVLTNSDLPGFSVSIPDGTLITGPTGWDGKITPPKDAPSDGTAPSGFSVGGTVIFVGSSQGTLTFSNPVTLLLSNVTGAVGYKPFGSDAWQTITNVCAETYENPTGAVYPGECARNNGTDTKIVTFHFTSFGNLDTDVCANIDGAQSGVPDGMHLDASGLNCVNFSQAGPPPQGPYTPPGQVLGISTTVPFTSWPKLAYAGTNGSVENVLGTETQATATPSPTPAPEVLATSDQPEKVGLIKWVLTHKKISGGVSLLLLLIAYGLYRLSKKNK